MKYIFWPVIFLYYTFLYWYSVKFLSFSVVEAKSVESFYLLRFLINVFNIKNDFSLRILPISFSFLSLIVFYNLCKIYLKEKYKYFSTLIFIFIPGFIISSVIINKAIFLIFFTLIFVYFFKKLRIFAYLLLIIYVFIDYSFISLYFALIFYSIYKKDTKLLLFSLLLLAVNANYFNYKIDGKPQGYFLDVFGTYILIFSPFVFVYFLFTFYKGFFLKKDILFFIGSFSFLLSIILSFRQRIKIDDYAPFVLPYVIYMIKVFLNSYKVRLPRFRRCYKFLFVFLFSTMILFDIAIFLNRYTPAKNLSGSFYFIKDLAIVLKKHNINKIKCNNKYLCNSLEFYGIKKGRKYKINYSIKKNEVSIFHNKKKILDINVSNLNTLGK